MRRAALLLCLGLAWPLGAHAEAAPAEHYLAAHAPEVRAQLQRHGFAMLEESDATSRAKRTVGYVIFEKPPGEVYRMLAQTERQAEFRPEVTSIETVERGERGPTDEHRLKILFRRIAYRLRYELDPQELALRWSLDPRFDNALQRVDGFWELHPMGDGRTLGRSGTQVDLGPALPKSLQDWVTRKNLPAQLGRVRAWVNDGDLEAKRRKKR